MLRHRLMLAGCPCEGRYMSIGHHHHHGEVKGHHHHGPPSPASAGRAFAIAVVLNVGFVIIDVVAGLLSGSMALLADAGHNLSAVLSLLIAWAASILSARPPAQTFPARKSVVWGKSV